MRRVLTVAYSMIVATKTPEEKAELDNLLSEEPLVEVGTGSLRRMRPAPTGPPPQTEQERQLLARGKRPPPWYPGAQKAVNDNLAAGRGAAQFKTEPRQPSRNQPRQPRR